MLFLKYESLFTCSLFLNYYGEWGQLNANNCKKKKYKKQL